MGAFDKLFGMGLIFAGILIFVYYSAWVFFSLVRYFHFYKLLQPFVHKQTGDLALFMSPVWLFRLPALALIGGISFIWFFISNTNKKIALAKAQAEAAKKNN